MATIRPAVPDDINAIRSVAHGTWPVAYGAILSPEQLAYMLERMYGHPALEEQFAKGHRFLIAEEGSTVIGFASCEHHYQGAINTRLHKLYVLPRAQGTGAGKALLQVVEAAARSAGDQGIELNVNRFNPSLQFYLRQGFGILRDEVLDIGKGYVMDDHVLVKAL